MTSQRKFEEKAIWDIFCKALTDSRSDPIFQSFAASLRNYAKLNGISIKDQKDEDSTQTRISIQDDSEKPCEQKVYPSFKRRNVRNISAEQLKRKQEEEKFIAHSFIRQGLNYSYISKIFPNMTSKSYRCIVEAVNNTNINDIIDYLRFELKVEIQRLNRDQKRTIRTRLTKIHEWLGNLDKSQLKTYFNFIRRHYDKNIVIIEESAKALYKTILGAVKTPFVNVLEADEDMKIGNIVPSSGDVLSSDEEKAILILYKEWKDVDKVVDLLQQHWGYEMKYGAHSVITSLKRLIDSSIDKLINSFNKADLEIYKNYFTQQYRSLIKNSKHTQLKIKLYDFYLEKQTNSSKVKELLLKLREFFDPFEKQKTKTEASTLEVVEQTRSESSQFELTKTIKAQLLKDEDFETEDEVKKEEEEQEQN